MKKLLRISSVKLVFSILLLTMTYSSCKKDPPSGTNSQSDKYSELKSWYNTEKLKSSDSILPGLKPDWSKIKIRQESTKIIYEIEVENPNKVFLANQRVNISNLTDAYKLSQFRLVIIFDQKTNSNQGAYMNILGDNNNESNKEVHYKKTGTFSGKIQYYGISGKYLNGWVYNNGKITKTIKESNLIPINSVKTEDNSCSVSATPRYGMICAGAESGGCTLSLLGYNYSISCQSFNPDYGEGGGGGDNGGGIDFGSGGGSPGTSPSPSPNEAFVNKIDDQKLKDCFKNVLQNLKNIDRACIPNLISVFSGNTPGYNWTMQDGILGSDLNAITKSTYDKVAGTATTTFDSGKFQGGSDLAIAKTILHESVHAYLVTYFNVDAMAAQKTYSQYVEDYNTTAHHDMNIAQHDELVRNFVGSVAVNLMTYGKNQGYNLPDQFYYDLSWGGLQETSAFKNFSQAVQQRIQDVIKIEQSGEDTNGNKRTPKGDTKGGC